MGHFWDGKGRLSIKYKVGDLVICRGSAWDGDDDWHGIVTKIDPWFMREKSGCQTESYAIEVLWHNNMEMGRHDISFGDDLFEIVGKANHAEK